MTNSAEVEPCNLRTSPVAINPVSEARCVRYPATRLMANVETRRQTASSIPIMELLRKKISGSIDGDAIQNDITGASGTPPVSSEVITGITPHEQNGLNAPTHVARKIDRIGLPEKARVMCFDNPERLIMTASGIVTSR